MSGNNFYNQNVQKSDGLVTCNRSILGSIINLAAKEVSGISRLIEINRNIFKRLFTRKNDGVKIKYSSSNSAITIDIFAEVDYGYKVSEVASRVQENIRNSVLQMMDIRILAINVNVLSVNFANETI